MPDSNGHSKSSGTDIFQLLTETARKDKKKRKQELLGPLNLAEIFPEGNLKINRKTCRGVECKLCIKACPTNALFWKRGEVDLMDDLCVYCGACVLSCIVDDCIALERRRPDGEIEKFSRSRDFTMLQYKINARKRFQRIEEVSDMVLKSRQNTKRDGSEAGKQ